MTEMPKREEITIYPGSLGGSGLHIKLPDYDLNFVGEDKICIGCKQPVNWEEKMNHTIHYGNISYSPGYDECTTCLRKRLGYE